MPSGSQLLQDKVVVVTGAGRGIGREVARSAAASGARVVVADVGVAPDGSAPTADVAEQVVRELRAGAASAVSVSSDVTTMAGAETIVRAALDEWGRVDGLVCCAAIVRHRPFLEMTEADWDAVVDVDLKGHFTMYSAAARVMAGQDTGGSIVGFASGYLSAQPQRANYRAAKAGVVALTMTAALDLEQAGVRVNCIAPVANTRLTAQAGVDTGGEAADVSPLAVYFLSDLSIGYTGQIITVAGASIAGWRDPFEDRVVRNPNGWEPATIAEEMPHLAKKHDPFADRPSIRFARAPVYAAPAASDGSAR